MLIVTIDLISGAYTPSQKRNLIHRVNEAVLEIEGEIMRDQVSVKINEINSGEWAVGGRPVEGRSLTNRPDDSTGTTGRGHPIDRLTNFGKKGI